MMISNRIKRLAIGSSLVALILGVALATAAWAGGRIVHHVSVGGADLCEALDLPTGCDANFSLVAQEHADGTVTGQWQDTLAGGGEHIHVLVDCLVVDGFTAYVGGVITIGTSGGVDVRGLRAVMAAVDNGTSQKDPADQISFSVFSVNFPDLMCTGALEQAVLDASLFDLAHGQVKVR